MGKKGTQILLLTVGLVLLSGCSSTPDYPPRPAANTPAQAAHGTHPGVRIARAMLGKPYRYGGTGPNGFDCSGLVYYSYQRAGIPVPRTTNAQLGAASPIRLGDLTPGDLLFFKLNRQPVSHVAIYTGKGRFIHAPSSGKRVSYGSMNDSYWKNRLIAAGRF